MNRAAALGVFLVSVFVYLKTLSVTVVFWDVGEFCAASWLLEVPHPPGSPLFVLLARIVSEVPFYHDIAARMHSISAVGSAIGVTFLYLVGVKVICWFRGPVKNALDRIIVYGASAIGALSMAFCATYWDNSIEAEVYGMSMLFVSMIIWLAVRWSEKAEEPHNEKYILLIAYLVGLSIGVHLLSLLALFTVMVIIYFHNHDYTRKNMIRFAVVAIPLFFVIYPGIVQTLPSMLDGEWAGIRSDLLPFIPLVILITVIYYAFRTYKLGQKMAHIACLSFILIVLGYTTYIEVIMRSNVHPPMNENNPSSLARLVSYLSREQYGDTPLLKGGSYDNESQTYPEKLFPRRWSSEGMHEPTRTNYTSDTDFFLRYQMYHMFLRYLAQDFIGAEGDWQDAGVSWKDTWGIPLLISLLGLMYHVRKDWKNSLPFIAMFLVMGVAFAFYANMQEPQPRERDYFYVGAIYAMCLWISLGVVAIADWIRNRTAKTNMSTVAVAGVVAACLILVPGNLMRVNWHEHDRSKEYVAWDYSYNLLQSCEQDAILLTNGDNDTFPLWYLQDVEGIRRDIRIVNLSLVNTSWYILQLKNETPFGAKKIPVSFTDAQIERLQPSVWKSRQMDIPVPREVAERFLRTDTALTSSGAPIDSTALKQQKITFTMTGFPYSQDTRILRVQDIMVWDIVKNNQWVRPLYFAVTCSPDSKIGLDSYMWMQGLAYKLRPFKSTLPEGGLDAAIMEANLMTEKFTPVKTPQHGFLWRNLNDPDVYYDENVQRMMINYRISFMRLADYFSRVKNDRPRAKDIMARMEDLMPVNVLPSLEWRLTAQAMNMYNDLGDTLRAGIYARNVEQKCWELINAGRVDMADPYNAYRLLLEIYDQRKDYASALDLMNRISVYYPDDASIKNRIQTYENLLKPGTAKDTNKAAPK